MSERFLSGKQAQLFVTESCDLTCDGCPYPGLSREIKARLKQEEIRVEEWKNVTDFLYKGGVRLFCVIGGEPATYEGVEGVVQNIKARSGTVVLLSTSGLHLARNPELRQRVGGILAEENAYKFKNGVVISFDHKVTDDIENARVLKAREGLKSILLLQEEYGDQITYAANMMVTPESLGEVLDIQESLEGFGIYTNLCTQQVKCFGGKTAIFSEEEMPNLVVVGREMIRRKVEGRRVVNSVAYLSQLPGIIGRESYRCWDEPGGSPVVDVGHDGELRYCNWITRGGVLINELISGTTSWKEFEMASRVYTQGNCIGCSWSRRDRNLPLMVPYNGSIFVEGDPLRDMVTRPELQNIWVQAQLERASS